jgi:mono/diheme cytochrome c family protein
MASRSCVILGASVVAVLALTRAAPRADDAPGQARKEPVKPSAQVSFTADIAPILAKYCTTCHGSGRRLRGNLSLARFKTDADARKEPRVWEAVAQNLRSGDMPPAGRARPSAAETDRLLAWIGANTSTVDCTQARDPGRVTLRRLNRVEYKNTIRDLVGISFKPADDFPADDVGYGFDNIGDVLSLSPLLMEKYLAAAEQIAATAFKDPAARKRLLIKPLDGKDRTEAARAILSSFARRAYRRPVTQDEVKRLLRFVDLATKNGDSFERGVQLAVQATLVSPHFLFRVERSPRGHLTNFPLTPHELATRLSYFLWSSMPDDELFTLAAEGTLRKQLEAQVRRMLRDPKARALTENFAGQWLQLRNLRTMTPDPGTYPGFDEALRSAMAKETELFFEAIVKEDRSVLDFLDADFTFVNERLARHYGLPGVKGPEFRRVSLAGTERRGVLTHASILTVTSNPTRTSPVKRGKWILDNILNTPPPPPPPDVPELEEQKGELKGSLRQRMEQHRANPNCATCHQRMDPLGFGFENFDGIGKWRTHEGKFVIDPSGELPGGKTFKGPRGLVAILKTRAAEFRRCLAEKMLTYALGRGLEAYDRCTLDDVCAAVARDSDRFSSLVLAIVRSDAFQKRKGRP